MTMKIKKGTGAFLVKVYSTDDNLSTCDYAIIEFSKQTLSNMLIMLVALMKIKLNNISSIYQLNCFDYTPDFLSVCEYDDYEFIPEELIDELEDFASKNEGDSVFSIERVGELSEDIHLIRQESTTMDISIDGVRFSTYIKHTNTELTTERILWENLVDYFQFEKNDHEQSFQEGWGLFECVGSENGSPQLQAFDEKGIFKDDLEAWEFVREADTELKRKALFELLIKNPKEFERIMKA